MAAAFTMIVVWVLIMVVMSGSALTSPSSAPSSGSRRGPVSGGAASKGAPAPTPTTPPPLSPEELWALREDARDMFYHAYDAYMKYGYGRRAQGVSEAATKCLCVCWGGVVGE
jgi:hypothetical protein